MHVIRSKGSVYKWQNLPEIAYIAYAMGKPLSLNSLENPIYL